MPIRRISQPSRGGSTLQQLGAAGKPDLTVWAEIDVKETELLINRVWSSLSGPSLEAFLQGPVHEHFEDEIVGRFAYQGDAQVGHWPDLSEATENIRAAQGFGADWPINVRTNEMFQAVTQDADYSAGSFEAEMMLPGNAEGAVAEKIQTAQEGRSSNPMSPNFGPTPARPVLAADEGDLAFVLTGLSRWIIWHVSGGFGGAI